MPKPRHKKRPFIGKDEKVRKFTLGPRFQRDPLVCDDAAPPNVLHEIEELDLNDIKEEEREHGIFFNDDYNYLKHMKVLGQEDGLDQCEWIEIKDQANGVREKDEKWNKKWIRKMQIPEIALPSKVEDEVGVLNRDAPQSGPRFDWDPDIVETLDDDFVCANVIKLGQTDSIEKSNNTDCDEKDESETKEDELDDILNEAMHGDEKEDVNYFTDDDINSSDDASSYDDCKFTNYSMTSSVVPRSENLQHLDDRFEKFFDQYVNADEINEDENGLDQFDKDTTTTQEGRDSIAQLSQDVLSDFERKWATKPKLDGFDDLNEVDVDVKKSIIKRLIGRQISSKRDSMLNAIEEEKEDQFDCQSILSTYSNLYHHPKVISDLSSKQGNNNRIKICERSGLPKDTLLGRNKTGGGLTARDLKMFNTQHNDDAEEEELESQDGGETVASTLASQVYALSLRSAHETLEEKRARKQGVKELRRQRVIERKINTNAFKSEKLKQVKFNVSNSVNHNKCIKIC